MSLPRGVVAAGKATAWKEKLPLVENVSMLYDDMCVIVGVVI
jgi:hypothetical protein